MKINEYFKIYEQHSDYENDSFNLNTPNVSYCESENELHFSNVHDYSKDYFTTVALEDGTITFTIDSNFSTSQIVYVSYSKDNGKNWTKTNNVLGQDITINVQVEEGDKVLWKGIIKETMQDNLSDYDTAKFSSTCNYYVEGNILSLLQDDDFLTIDPENLFSYGCLFKSSMKLLGAKNLILPPYVCFWGYIEMFSGCSNLTSAPKLPATKLDFSCYSNMFHNCMSLVNAPELPATELASSCYYGMFSGCISLVNAPELPATDLIESCYRNMFNNCISLKTAPELTVNYLSQEQRNCFDMMFYGCENLTKLKVIIYGYNASIENFTSNWLTNASQAGTFLTNDKSLWISPNNSLINIPSRWKIIEI